LKFQGFSPLIAGDDAVTAVVAHGFQNVPQELGVKGEKTGLTADVTAPQPSAGDKFNKKKINRKSMDI